VARSLALFSPSWAWSGPELLAWPLALIVGMWFALALIARSLRRPKELPATPADEEAGSPTS
jgi:hypothetical protein